MLGSVFRVVVVWLLGVYRWEIGWILDVVAKFYCHSLPRLAGMLYFSLFKTTLYFMFVPGY